ncbi:hypothetical protein [Streptomyces genisteinicus]|nr:hypothetical protein [Streptomyces genisteinicus]
MGATRTCKQCRRPLDPRRRRPKRFCNRRHQVRHWVEEILDAVFG